MRHSLIVLGGLSLILSGCTELKLATHFTKQALDEPAPYSAPAITEKRKVGNPYQIEGVWYHPVSESDGYTAKGIASWYGKEFHGKPTANGESYNMYEMTAAHPTLPLPTYARVTNLNNGKSVVVRINDRGPFLRGRVIDLSYRAAQALGYIEQGTAPVLIEALPADGSPLLASARPENVPFKQYGDPSSVPTASLPGTRPMPNPPHLSGRQSPPPTAAKAPVKPQQGGSFTNRVSAAAGKPQTIENAFPAINVEMAPPLNTVATVEKVQIYVQTGSFGDKSNAQKQADELRKTFATAYVAETQVNGKTFYRVRVGPVETVDMADQVLARALHQGYKNAIIVVD
jgi:rare lipoprotein A